MSEPEKDLRQLLVETKEEMGRKIDELSKRIELNEDTVKMLSTEKLAQSARSGEYVPSAREFGPTGHYLVEPRSRWKRTSLYGH